MLEKLRVVFTIPELRQKILLTLFLLAVYRVGYLIPMPMVDANQIQILSQSNTGGLAGLIAKATVFSASQLDKATIFGLGIMPYITASIILQLLGTVYPPLMELRKEGEAGRKKINEYTRYLTVALCLVQSVAYVWYYLMPTPNDGPNLIADEFENADGTMMLGWQIVAVLIMTGGTIFLMWLGEQIDEYGIGNGISLLIMAGIVADMPGALSRFIKNSSFELTGFGSTAGIETYIVLVALFVGVVFGVVFITLAQRRIPTQSAKHVRGRRVYGGTRQYLPLKINQAGVMPIIFASSLLMLPALLFNGLASITSGDIGTFFGDAAETFGNGTSFIYNFCFLVMIYFFCYFWTSIIFNPKEISDNLKEQGTFIPGYRPGRRTADYLERVMDRITYVGAGFLAVVAVVPTVVSSLMGVDYQIASFYGGTGLLIAVSVAFDLVQKIDSHLVMRNYRGLLE
ncbi:MAG TPA: preprotein translocase subunit SecY [Pirellulaceae bacterium]|nr:preprotein translocase subunit SecY [Pirellulaceae bacterium]